MDTSAQGLRVLITAGASGIGYAFARTFSEAGARVHICDIDEAALARTKVALPTITQTRKFLELQLKKFSFPRRSVL